MRRTPTAAHRRWRRWWRGPGPRPLRRIGSTGGHPPWPPGSHPRRWRPRPPQAGGPQNLNDLFPAPALPDGLLALGQLVGNLQVHVLGHVLASSPVTEPSLGGAMARRPRITIW